MEQQQLVIWFAGFYEGEGCIFNDVGNRNKIRVSISQNDKKPLEIGQKIWGGHISHRIRKSSVSDKICEGYEWRMGTKQSKKFLEDIKPYMIIPYKINQIKKCLKKEQEPWDKSYKCNFCVLIYKDAQSRRRHEKKEHIEKGKEFKCEKCDNIYKSRDSMKRHMRINHPKSRT